MLPLDRGDFAENGTKADALATVAATRTWAEERNRESLATAHAYLAGAGAFQERVAQATLAGRFLTDFYATVARWAEWASATVGVGFSHSDVALPPTLCVSDEVLARHRQRRRPVRRSAPRSSCTAPWSPCFHS